jgi:hypothetical protein
MQCVQAHHSPTGKVPVSGRDNTARRIVARLAPAAETGATAFRFRAGVRRFDNPCLQEIDMSDQQSTAQGSAAPEKLTGKSFGEMSGSEKLTFIGKAFVMLLTGGFVFPNIFVE